MHLLRAKWNTQGEVGWKRVSKNREGFYLALLDWFISNDELQFRCLVADKQSLHHDIHSGGDSELGFYKLYYQLLVHWLTPECSYRLYLDWQQNRQKDRFSELRRILGLKLSSRLQIVSLEPAESNELELMQLTDLLSGAVGYVWNQRDLSPNASKMKVKLARHLASSLGWPDLLYSTSPDEQKFNIFGFPNPHYRTRAGQ